MFYQYREITKGEFFVIGGDCSQGGADSNESHFLSVTKKDFPLVYRAKGVAANMTDAVFPVLEWVFDKTGVKPIVAFERNNGGASEMRRLFTLNRNKKYEVFSMKKIGTDDIVEDDVDTDQLGYSTTALSRPTLVGDWKDAIDSNIYRIYDEPTIKQHKTFIINKVGKPIASGSNHDDAVIAPAIAHQLAMICKQPKTEKQYQDIMNQLPQDNKFKGGFY